MHVGKSLKVFLAQMVYEHARTIYDLFYGNHT